MDLVHVRRAAARRWRAAAGSGGAAVLLATVALAGCGSSDSDTGGSGSASGGGSTDSLTVSVRSVADAYAPLYWAKAKGYFAKQGLDLDIAVGGQGTIASLAAGRTDLAGVSQAAAFGMAKGGKDPVSVFATDAGSIAYVFAADPKIKSPAQCHSMTTSVPGTNVYAWSVLMQQIFSVKWRLAQLTDVPSFAGSVLTGRTDCGMGSLSIYQQAVAQGKLRVIFDPTKPANLPPNWPKLGIENVWLGMGAQLKQKRAAVEKFLKGYLAAARDFAKTDASAIAGTVLADKDWAGYTVKSLAPDIEAIKLSINPDDGYIAPGVWSQTVDFFRHGGYGYLNDTDPEWSYKTRVDMSYYDAAIGKPR